MVINPSNILRSKRRDLSPYLFHFTNGSNSEEKLEKILGEKCLRSPKGVICFTDSPLTSYYEILDYMASYRSSMYSSWGIGFNRDVLIKNYDARPVIYGSNEEEVLLDNELKWRFQKIDVDNYDFSWLREWRIKGYEFDFKNIKKDDIIIITPTKLDFENLTANFDVDIEFNYEHEIGKCIPSVIYSNLRGWKGFAIEEVRDKYTYDNQLYIESFNQEIGEELK